MNLTQGKSTCIARHGDGWRVKEACLPSELMKKQRRMGLDGMLNSASEKQDPHF